MRTPPTDARPTATREPASRREVRRRQAQQIGREQLLDAAEDLFSRRGFHDTSLREVARLAEFSVGSVYSFFESKDDLYRQVFIRRGDEFLAGLRTVVEAGDDPVTTLHAMLDFEVSFFRSHASFGRLYLRSANAALQSADRRGAETSDARYDEAMQLQAAVFERGRRAGTFHDGEPVVLARLFSGLVASYQSLDPGVAGRDDATHEPMPVEEFHALISRAFVVPD